MRPIGEASVMSETPENAPAPEEETTTLGTIGWVGAVIGCAVVALLLLSWLGPLGER
jgi:hypothetical protein